jgi:hypothetical protein
LGTGSVCSLMSALGQNQTLKHVRPMSALHPKADMVQHNVISRLFQQQTCNPFVIARRWSNFLERAYVLASATAHQDHHA